MKELFYAGRQGFHSKDKQLESVQQYLCRSYISIIPSSLLQRRCFCWSNDPYGNRCKGYYAYGGASKYKDLTPGFVANEIVERFMQRVPDENSNLDEYIRIKMREARK